jgi:hypothetical protein
MSVIQLLNPLYLSIGLEGSFGSFADDDGSVVGT